MKKLWPVLLLAVLIVGLALLIPKLQPMVPPPDNGLYQSQEDSILLQENPAIDSLEIIIASQKEVIDIQTRRLADFNRIHASRVDSVRKQPPDKQVEFFALKTGVDSITIRIEIDTICQVLISSIRIANILIIEGENAKETVCLLKQLNQSKEDALFSYQELNKHSLTKIGLLEHQKSELSDKVDSKEKELRLVKKKFTILKYATCTLSGVFLVLLVL